MKRLVIILMMLSLTILVKAQLVVDINAPYNVPNYLVQNMLLGNGVTATNVTYYGHPTQIGYFNGAASTIGINEGIVLSSGEVSTMQIPGFPDTDIDMTYGPSASFGGGDSDLLTIAQSVTTNPQASGITSTHDVAILEFDFVPNGDTLKFNFVFASEEYTTFINSSFNDVFAFLISGPGLTGPYAAPVGFPGGATNIALVPGSTLPITISTIYTDPFQTPPSFNGQYYIDNPNSVTHEMNGFTTVLTAITEVQCGQTYHIKIAVADAQDGILDTGVLLEAGSFSSNAVTLNSSVDIGGNDSILYESCGTALLDFIRDNPIDTAVYNFTITGTAGTSDYVISADSVVFLPGQDTITLTFDAIQDGLVEPLETVVIQLVQTICSVVDTQIVTFYISDFPQPVLATNDTLIGCGSNDSVPIWVDVIGPPHTTLWNTGEITDTIWVNPTTTTTYYVTVSDTCGVYNIVDSATVTIISVAPILITMPNDTSKYCPQDSMWVYVNASGGAGSLAYSWSPGGTTDTSMYVSPSTTTTYIVDVLDACGTLIQDSVTITVPIFVPLTNMVTTNDTVICPSEIVVLDANVNGGVGTYLSWNNGVGNVIPTNVNPITTTSYILTAQDSCGAIVKDSVLVTINNAVLQVSVDDYTMDCLNETVTLTANVIGANGTETYLWNTGATTPAIQVNPLATTNYSVDVTDACSTYIANATITVPIFAPLILTINSNTSIHCPGDPVILAGTITGGAQSSLVITWSDGINTFTGNNITVNPITTTTYSASISDTCAFDNANASFTVTVPIYQPLQMTVSNDLEVCVGDSITLFALVTGGDGNYNYSWNGGFSSDTLHLEANYNSNYNVLVTDGCGSTIANSTAVTVISPTADFSYEYTSEFTVQFTDSSYNDIVGFWWNFDLMDTVSGANPTHTFSADGEHDVWLIVMNQSGCYDTIMKTIKPPMFIYGPNSFSPDGDGVNDEFMFKGMGIKFFELFIFDRWGELLFQTSSMDRGWDGTYKGKYLPGGVYVYKVRAESYEGLVNEKAGSITLFK